MGGSWVSANALFNSDWTPQMLEAEAQERRPRRNLAPSWHEDALCAGMEEKTFFGATDVTQRPALSVADVSRAQQICNACPAFEMCLRTALGVDGGPREEYGVWAGTSGRTRRRIWEQVDAGLTTLLDVVEQVMSGNGGQYESKVALTQRTELVRIRQEAS